MSITRQPSFDFEAFDVDASEVLVKIWNLLQIGLSESQVARLNGEFVSGEIFDVDEIRRSKNSETFLDILSRRSDSQKAQAINIICAKPVQKAVREEVQKYFAKSIIPTRLGAEENTGGAMNVVIRDVNQINPLIRVLKSDPVLDWQLLGIELGVDSRSLKLLQARQLIDIRSYDSILREIIEIWIQQEGNNATLSAFLNIMNRNGYKFCSEKIAEAFGQ